MRFIKYFFIILLTSPISLGFALTKYEMADSRIEQLLFNKINVYRADHGLRILKLNKTIIQEAKQHSLDMAENRLPFGHDQFNSRMKRLSKKFETAGAASENVAYTYQDPLSIIPQWLKSRPHRENIEGNFNVTGIGVAHGQNGKIYITQIFMNV